MQLTWHSSSLVALLPRSHLSSQQNVRVRRAGFAFRQTFDRFQSRYKMLSKDTWPNSPSLSAQQACRAILSSLSASEGQQYQCGRTKIFIRQPMLLFTLEELRERKLHQLATMIQSRYRSYRARKYFRELREKSLGLFGRNKLRRRASVRRFFVGDYLRAANTPAVTKLLQKHKEVKSTVLFCDLVDKINRKGKSQRRVMLLTSQAVYNLNEGKLSLNRRIAISDVSACSVSPLADNFVVIHGNAKEYDTLLVAERKVRENPSATLLALLSLQTCSSNCFSPACFALLSARPSC